MRIGFWEAHAAVRRGIGFWGMEDGTFGARAAVGWGMDGLSGSQAHTSRYNSPPSPRILTISHKVAYVPTPVPVQEPRAMKQLRLPRAPWHCHLSTLSPTVRPPTMSV
eukprot:1158396-Pelagomonas_calceolata.AAC.15